MSDSVNLPCKIKKSEWFYQPSTLQVYIYLLIHAATRRRTVRGVKLVAGQLLTSKKAMAAALKAGQRRMREVLAELDKAEVIKTEALEKYTLITVCGYIPPEIKKPKPQALRQPSMPKPTPEEVAAYCNERNNNIDAFRFFDYYESVGWKVGRQPMKDWRAAVRTWERRSVQQQQPVRQKDTVSHNQNKKYERF